MEKTLLNGFDYVSIAKPQRLNHFIIEGPAGLFQVLKWNLIDTAEVAYKIPAFIC